MPCPRPPLQPPPASDPRGGTFCSRCLFDLLADEGEHVNIAADHPEIVEKLAARLATYRYYTQAEMSAEEMRGYEHLSTVMANNLADEAVQAMLERSARPRRAGPPPGAARPQGLQPPALEPMQRRQSIGASKLT